MSSTAAFILILKTAETQTAHTLSDESISILSILKKFSDAEFRVHTAMGFQFLQIRFNSNDLFKENFQGKTKEVLEFGKTLGTDFICLSHYEYQLETLWIENEILSPILLDDYEALKKLPLEKIWLSTEIQ